VSTPQDALATQDKDHLDFYLVGRVASARVVLFFSARKKKKQLTTSPP
jgi:hypothetical protein